MLHFTDVHFNRVRGGGAHHRSPVDLPVQPDVSLAGQTTIANCPEKCSTKCGANCDYSEFQGILSANGSTCGSDCAKKCVWRDEVGSRPHTWLSCVSCRLVLRVVWARTGWGPFNFCIIMCREAQASHAIPLRIKRP